MKSHTLFNAMVEYIYYLLIAIPVFYFLVSTYSFFSVLITLGDVPPYDTMVDALAKQKSKTIFIFPVKYGRFLISLLIIELLFFWIWILLNYISSRFVNGIIYHKKLVLILTIANVISFLTMFMPPFGRWYLGYVFD